MMDYWAETPPAHVSLAAIAKGLFGAGAAGAGAKPIGQATDEDLDAFFGDMNLVAGAARG